MIDGLAGESRLIIKATLTPVVGSAFQPTGFPDLGAAEFERPIEKGGAEKALLVESVQSLANRLEDVGWDPVDNRPVSAIAALPYVEVRDKDGRFLTSSRLEPHRLAGAYIKQSKIDGKNAGDLMIERLGVQKEVPTDWRAVYKGIFQLDPLCLIHGVFFSDPSWKEYGNPKVRRVITAVIEAHGTRPVVSGGVKRDDVNPTAGESRTSKEGFGFVPFGRTEYTAETIELDAAVDLEQINGYGLDDAETDLLTTVALWEVRTLLDRPMRLRTACDLELQTIEIRRPNGFELPSGDALADRIAKVQGKFESDSSPLMAIYG